ncbi:hypothetical protein [Longispora albida]|uniref:hypothetical protein n=1 Tax=Longispora albida TaxID=203523 RepID=UPI0012FC5AB8|nr:hypothetical protein [Longispora albida]
MTQPPMSKTPSSTLTRTALIAAPLAIVAYGVTRSLGKMDGHYGPGFDWQLAHIFALAGMVLFLPVVLLMRRLAKPGLARECVTGVTLAGLGAAIVQFGADIVQAFLAEDQADLKRLQHEFMDLPGVELAFYQVGPQLFFLGLVVLAAFLAVARRVPAWSPVLILAGVLLVPVNLTFIIGTGLLMLVALLPLARAAGTPARA